jgi:hypothetical protein
MTTQDLITKAEISDTIFEALSPAYKHTNKYQYDSDLRYRYLLAEAVLQIDKKLIPNTVTPTEAVKEFFNRL